MIRPVYIYGSSVLRKVAQNISPDYPNIKELITDMFETMYHSDGVGLAAPQIGLSIRLFVIDATPFEEDDEDVKDFKKVFINAKIIERSGERKLFNEGCLSIPNIREDVERDDVIRMQYLDENFEPHEEEYSGIRARIIQHEYDHLEGMLFTDKVSPIRRQLLRNKLAGITKGRFSIDYKFRLA
ncbi:MAG: peptide deformylase [Bacteroidales bacterium]|nr:peptide deformylase [Bacteroidales bacterium]MBN2747928.1 peptide deformylase [Bacteroidales bacterium]